MTSVENMTYKFVSQAYADEPKTFFVKSFSGHEGISKLYEFDVHLLSDDTEIDLKSVLTNPAALTFERDEGDLVFHGIVAHFEQLPEIRSSAQYRAVLVPRLWQADLYHQNQLFLDKTVPDIITEVLEQTGLTSQDYEFRLTGNYPEWEHICQYDETDFAFISRWMEREGISFFFEQTEQGEKLIITDSASAHMQRPEETISYIPPTGEEPEDDVVLDFVCIHQRLPRKVILQDYNYRSPSQMLRAEADVDPQGQGDVYIYGEHYKNSEQGNALARIRAESLLCREQAFHGQGIVPDLSPGFLFTLDGHFRASYNQQYLITDISHQGSQTGFHSDTGGQSGQKYSSVFSAIPSQVQYRPERKTPKPKLFGTMNAKVDASGDGQYAELDDQGRYKVILPFDLSGRSEGKASRFVRMAQPYAGSNYGMHLPLHKDAEVLLTFIDGDPDRPLIAAAIPNPETASPVNSENQTQGVIWSAGENRITFEDQDGDKSIHIYQACGNEIVLHEKTPNITIKQECGNEMTMKAEGKTIELKQDNNNLIIMDGANQYIQFYTPFQETTFEIGNCPSGKKGFNKKTAGDWYQENIGNKVTKTFGFIEEYALSAKATQTVGLQSEIYFGGKHSTLVGGEIKINKAKEVTKNIGPKIRKAKDVIRYDSEKAIELTGGSGDEGQLTLDKDGAWIGCKGTTIDINPDSDINIDSKGNISIKASGNISIDSDGDILLKSKGTNHVKGKLVTPNIKDLG